MVPKILEAERLQVSDDAMLSVIPVLIEGA